MRMRNTGGIVADDNRPAGGVLFLNGTDQSVVEWWKMRDLVGTAFYGALHLSDKKPDLKTNMAAVCQSWHAAQMTAWWCFIAEEKASGRTAAITGWIPVPLEKHNGSNGEKSIWDWESEWVQVHTGIVLWRTTKCVGRGSTTKYLKMSKKPIDHFFIGFPISWAILKWLPSKKEGILRTSK